MSRPASCSFLVSFTVIAGIVLLSQGALGQTCGTEVPWGTCASGAPTQYKCWQQTLLASKSYQNAYRNLTVRVTFTSTSEGPYTIDAFWDGVDPGTGRARFVFRNAFDWSGNYQWSTSCQTRSVSGQLQDTDCSTDTGLVRPATSVTVAARNASDPNVLFARGRLRPDTLQSCGMVPPYNTCTYTPPRHFDNTAFFWHGDTAWAATMRACRSEWRSYVDDRKAKMFTGDTGKGFTVVHLALAPTWEGPPYSPAYLGSTSRRSQLPFTQVCTETSYVPNACSQPNVDFWRELDGMVQYANDKGLLVFIPGLIEPVHRWASQEETDRFARHLAARMAGSAVVLSPGFDNDTSVSSTLARIRSSAQAVRLASPHLLLTNHTGTDNTYPTVDYYSALHGDTWLGFSMFQSGFGGSAADLSKITGRPRARPPVIRGWAGGDAIYGLHQKHVVNGEAIYDFGYGSTSATPFNAFRARQAGYLSWFSGAAGYTFGSAGLWEWGICAPPNSGWEIGACSDNPGIVPQQGALSYSQAMGSEASNQMVVLRDTLRRLDWWWPLLRTQPAEQERIDGNASLPDPQKMVLARDSDAIAVYLPHNDSVRVRTSGTNVSPSNARFYNSRGPVGSSETPRSMYEDGVGSGWWKYFAPQQVVPATDGSSDWVLIIGASTSSSLIWSGTSDRTVEAWPEAAPSSGWFVKAQIFDTASRAVDRTFLVATTGPNPARKIRAARDGGGVFTLVWEQETSPSAHSIVELARFDARGVALERPEAPMPLTVGADMVRPSAGADSEGNVLVAWQEIDAEGSSRIVAMRYGPVGDPEGGSFVVSRDRVERARSPRVACSTSGDCAVAWEAEDPRSGQVVIRVQRFDETRSFEGLDERLDSKAASDAWLNHLSIDAKGVLEARWEKFDVSGQSRGYFRSVRAADGEPVSTDEPIPTGEGRP